MSVEQQNEPALARRMEQAMGDRTVRHVGVQTGTHPETVRRYISGNVPPSVDFLASFCEALEINADWLLSGRGPMRVEDKRKAALREAGISEVLRAMAQAVDRLSARVDRLEAVVRLLDDRVKASPGAAPVSYSTVRRDEGEEAAEKSGGGGDSGSVSGGSGGRLGLDEDAGADDAPRNGGTTTGNPRPN